MKRVISLVLLLAMLCACFAGCGSKEDTGHAHLIWAMPWYEQSEHEMVEGEINKILAEKLPDTELEFLFDSSLASKWSLLMAGNTQIDIANVGFNSASLVSEIPKKSFYGLNDLVDKYAPTIKEQRDETYELDYLTGSMNGELYAIPHVQMHVNDTAAIQIPKAFEKYLDLDAFIKECENSVTTTDKMYQLLDAYLHAAKSAITAQLGKDISEYINLPTFYSVFARRGYDFIGAGPSAKAPSNIGYKAFEDKVKLVDFYTTDEFKTYVKWAKKWYDDGFISKDILSGDTGIGSKTPILYAYNTNMYQSKDGKTFDQFTEKDYGGRLTVAIQTDEQKYLSHCSLGGATVYTAIPSTAKYPERAIRLLELIRTDEGADILNLICYGVEGKQYEKVSETEIKTFEYEGQASSSTTYGVPEWMICSHFAGMYINAPYSEDLRSFAKNYYEKVRPNSHKTPIYGMSFNLTEGDLGNDVSQWEAVLTEYHLQVISGATPDTNATLAAADKKLKEVGVTELIKTLQKQVDDYVKSNK